MAEKKKPPAAATNEPRIELLLDAEAVLAEVASREQLVRDKAFAIAQRRAAPVDPMLDWLEAERSSYRRAATRVSQLRDSYRVEIELPGVSKKDVEIRVTAGRIVVRAVRRTDDTPAIALVDEFGAPELWRDVQLPPDSVPSSIAASFEQGILVLDLARTAPPVAIEPPAEAIPPAVKKPTVPRAKKRAK